MINISIFFKSIICVLVYIVMSLSIVFINIIDYNYNNMIILG